MIDINGVTPEQKLFHNIRINVYPTEVRLEDISYWKENLRTLLSFSLLEKKNKKELSKIPLEDIVNYLAKQRGLQIEKLASSIERNGVRVPLIILERGGRLMDGNRRFFACHYLLRKAQKDGIPRPAILDKIPVWVIKNKDIPDFKTEQKILAEANFVPDYKVPWTDDVKAKVIDDYFNHCIKNKNMTREEAYKEIFNVYSVERPIVDVYIASIKLCKEFIKVAPRGEKDKHREIIQSKFVYFWEFRNKAYTKKMGLDEEETSKVKDLFFSMMSTDRFKNMKQIEPMIRSVRDKDIWKMLKDSYGSKIDQVEAIYREKKAIKSAEDKIRYFYNWLNKADISGFSKAAISLIHNLSKKCVEIITSISKK